MKETTFVVTVNADGKYNTKMYSEEDYNSKVVPFLSERYTPDQYSVAGLQDTTADNITEDGQYIVSVDANGATHRKTYTGKELLGGKLTTIGQQFPDYRLQYVDGAVRPAEGSDDIIAVPWQKQMGAKIAQQKDNIGKTLKEVDETVADVKDANLSDLLKERGDAMTNFANMAVYNGLTKTPEELEAMHQEDLYRRDLRDINKELEDVNNQLDEWVQHEIDIEDFGGPNLQWILDNAARKDELLTRKADLIQRQTSNPYYKREDKRLNEIADNVIAKAYPALADLSVEGDIITPNNPEADVWQAARYFADKAKTTLSAPDDNANGFVSFLKGHGARFSDADFWLAGLESIASNMKVKKVFDTISSKLASYADQNIEKELTDGDLDYLLSDAEKQLLLSFVTASEAEALRAQNTNNMYNAGVTSAESLGFMAQFILTGGVGDAFAAGSKRAARGLATWLAKNTGKIGTRAASMASKAGATLVGRGATAAADAVVTPFLKSIPMTLMQTGLYKDYAQKLTERDEAGNLKYDYDTAVLPALRDAGLEVWSEMALEPVLSVFGKTMGIGIDKLAGKSKVAAMFNTKLDDLATFFHNREAMEILAKAGFDGYFEEIGEEILAAGVSSLWEPEAWSQFWEKDNLVTMAVAFAPMSIIGGGMSMANYVKREIAYDEIAPSVQEMLARRGVLTEEQISELFNREVNTMQDVADKISGIINPIIASGQITAEEFKTLYDFAGATAQKDIANALVKRAEEDRRIVMRNNMDQRMNGKQYTGKDAEGNETISFYEDEKGNRRYVVVDAGNTDGLCLSMDENGKDLKIVNVNELEVTTMGANAFFDNMWKEEQAAQESQRMQDDAARQRQSVAQALKSGKPVQMYNPQTNEREDYVFLGWNGEAAVMANAKTGVEEERTIQDLANALHISDTVLTDAQREQAQIDESRKNDSIARSANDYKGAPVNFNGVSGTLLRLSSRGDENGNSSLVASIITSNGELVPVNVTADMVEDFIQERKDLASSGNAAAADRRTRDHERKEQQRKDSEAYRSSKEKYTNPDGSVREGEFLDNDPRGFAMYSDGKYGKADTDATLAAALANAQTKAQQALQAKEAEANPDVKAGLRDQYQRAVAALDTLDMLLNERHQDESSNGELAPDAARAKYQEYEDLGLSDDEIYELGMRSIDEIRERIAALPVPAVSTDVQSYMDQKKKYSEAVAAEQKKIDYWRSILSAPMTESEKKDVARANARMQRRVADILAEKAATKDAGAIARLDKELKDVAEGFIGQAIADINTEGDPVVISTAATIEKDMRDAGSTERAITNVLSAIQKGYQPRGIFDPTSGAIFFIADYNTDVAEARNTFIHERQHKRTREAGLAEILIDRLGLTGRTEEEKKAVLLPELAKLIRTSFYDGKSARDIADEIISYSVEHEFNGALDSLGLNDIITNFAKNIDNERSNAAGLSEPGRNGNVNESYRVTDQGDERAQEAESGAVAGQGSGSLESGEETVGLTEQTQKELAEKGLVMDGGVVMASALSDLKQATGYLTPNEISPEADAVAFSIRTKNAWAANYRKYPGSEERVIRALENLAERMAADELVSGVISQGDYKYGKKANGSFAGPLRTNIEYVVTFDMDTTCPRTFQYLNYVKQIEKRIGRPLTQTECIQLTEMMRMYGQQIPCVYCYSENKRQAMKQYYTDFMTSRQAVLNAETDEEALEHMYGHGTSKAAKESKDPAVALNEAAYKVFLEWRANRKSAYNPSLKMLWFQYSNDRNTVLSVLDQLYADGSIMTDLNDDVIAAVVDTKLRINDKQAVKVVEDIVSEWKWDAIEGRQHSDYTPVDEDEWVVDPRTLSLWREMTAYAKSASQAKSVLRYVPYTDELKKLSQEQKDYINGMGGVRMHSSNDFRIDYVFDYFQFMADMAANKMFGHTYTKSPEFVRIFGNSGYKINMSIAAYEDENGNIRMNEDEGFNWDEAKRLREAFPNAGIMLMATSDNQIQMALDSDWIDMFIPFHASSLPKAVWYNMRMWQDYSTVQNEAFLNGDEMKAALIADGVELPKKIKAADVEKMYLEHFKIKSIIGKTGKKKGKRLRPHFLPGPTVVDGQYVPGHNNDPELYKQLCREYGVHPRFFGIKLKDGSDITEHPNYIKCIKETARTDSPQTPVQFNFDQPSEALGGKTPIEYAFDELQVRAAAEMESAGAPVRDIYKSLEKDTFGIVPQFIDTIIKHKEKTGKDYPLDYITPDSRKWFLTERRALEEAYKDVETIPYHRNEYDIDGEPMMRVAANTEDQAEIQKALDLVNGVKTFQEEDGDVRFSIRTKPAPKNTGIGYKVFYLKDGKLYPPMVANPDGADTPVGVWLDADAAPQAATSKTGRKKVKAGGKGTQGGSGTLAYRPGWHLGEIPYALQFNRGPKVDNPLGITGKNGKVIKVGKYFPANFVWAEVEYAKDVDYQDEAMSYGYNEAGNFQHSLAGLPKVPEDGSYTYRTNANPATDPWIITGAMKVNRILTDSEVDELVSQAGREPQEREVDEKAFEERMAVVNRDQKRADGQYADAAELDNIMFRLSNNNRATISKWLDKWAEARVNEVSKKYGANTPRESFEEAAAKQKEEILNYLDKLNDSTMQLAWARWFCIGAVQMGAEDMPKVRQAVKIAKIHKVDPLQYDSPMAIIDQWPESIKEDPINPDEITTLHKVKELPDGLVIYDVDESEESRKNMREIINTHFGKDCSPWCLLQGDGKGKLTKYSADYWYNTYTAYTKQVAFKNGKLVAFSANSNEERLWWDRQDSSHHGIPVIGKIKGDKLGRSATMEYSPEDGSLISVTNIVKGNKKDGKYMEWFSLDNETPRVEETFEHGYLVGRRVINYPNGQIRQDENYEKGSLSGRAVTYFDDGQIETDANYVSGRLDGPFTSYHENGQVYYSGTYERGDKVGRWQTFYSNGQISEDEVYAKSWKPIESITYYPDGSKKSESHSVSRPYGFGTVSEQEWDEQGRLVRSVRMMESSTSHGYYDGDLHEITEYEYNGLGITMKKVEAYQGQRGMTLYSALYFDDVLQKQTFVDKGAYNYNDVIYDEWYTADGKLATVTVQKLEKYNGDTVVDQLKYKYDEDGNVSVKHLMMPRGLGYVKDEDLLVSETRDLLPGETIPSVDKLYQDYQAKQLNPEEEQEKPAPAKKKGKSIKETVEETLAAANLYIDEGMDGDISIGGTVNGQEYSFMVFDDFTYEDFLENGYTEDELGRANPEQEEAYAKVQDEIDYYQTNGYWRDEADELVRQAGNEPSFRVVNNNQQVFISNSLASLVKIPMKSGNAQAWINKIQQAGGLKKEEDKWMGLTDWLKEQKGNISKEDVAEFIREHQVQIEEVKYGDFNIENYRSAIAEKMGIEFRDKFLEAFDVWPDNNNYKGFYTTVNFDNDAAELYNEYHEDMVNGDDLEDEELDKIVEWSEEIVWSSISDGYEHINPIRLDYTTDGLLYKREIALTVPTIDPYNKKDDIHFGDAGEGRAIAWARFGEAVDENGNRVLVIDEIQSKRHQEGKEKGYDSVPDAPFRDSWDALAMKRMLRLAAEEGYDKIAWTNGSMQAERYNIGHVVDHIRYDGMIGAGENQGAKIFTLKYKDKGTDYVSGDYDQAIVNESGDIVMGQFQGNKLSELVGKDIATEMLGMNERGSRLEGESLRIGGEGMRYFYDQKLVNWMNKYGKKWGVQVADLTLPYLENTDGWHSVDVTPEMKESVMEGQPMFRIVYHGSGADFDKFDMNFISTGEGAQAYGWGVYVTTNKDTGVNYANVAGNNQGIGYAQHSLDELTLAEDYLNKYPTEEDFLKATGAFITDEERASSTEDELKEFDKYVAEQKKLYAKNRKEAELIVNRPRTRHLYTVEIPDDNGENYLHWDETLTRAQSRKIINGIIDRYGDKLKEDYGDDYKSELRSAFGTDVFGSQVEGSLNYLLGNEFDYATGVDHGAERNAKFLNSLGIVGMQVPIDYNGGQRYSGSNYVIYDVNDARITDNIAFRVVELTPETRGEMEQIEAIARVNGTYLKAPNGADTKLTPEQWAMVRTKAFTDWFGDWESAAKRVDENVQFKDLIGKTIIGYRYGKAPEGGRSFNTLTRSYESGVSMASVGYNAEVGSFAATANEEEGKYYYIGEIAEETGGDDEICLNNVRELTKEEYESLLPQYTAISNAVANAYYNRSANVASRGYDIDLESAKAKRDAAIREIDSSKVVDENGEPMVVYHASFKKSGQAFTTFDRDKSIEGFYFTNDRSFVERWIGDTYVGYSCFMNLRNPFLGDAKGNGWAQLDAVPELNAETTAEVAFNAEEAGYDGVILRNVNEGGRFGKEVIDDYIAFSPNQIKSATVNTGSFDPTDPDIRYRVTPEQDEEYRKAYEAGDVETARKMVDEVAKKAGYNYKGYHGSWGGLRDDEWEETPNVLSSTRSFYLASDKKVADSHAKLGEESKPYYVRLNNPMIVDAKGADYAYINDPEGEYSDIEVSTDYLVSRYKARNQYDGLIIENVDEVGGLTTDIIPFRRDNSQVKSAEPFTFDDNGELIPLSQRFNPESNDVRFRVTPEVDEAYKDAVDAGDMRMAQSLVDAAAESAMADSQVRDENGKLLHMYHGTKVNEKFYVFDTFNERSNGDLSNVGSHFGPKSTAQEFSKDNLYDVYLNLKKVWEAPFDFFADIWNNAYLEALIDLRNQCEKAEAKLIFDRIYDVYPILATYDLNKISIVDEFYNDEGLEDSAETDSNTGAFKVTKAWSDHRNAMVQIMRDMMEAEGFDGISYENWYEGEQGNLCYVALYPSQIKSADAVTYDNQGNMIPLSQRFTDNDDIRFRVSPEQEDAFQKAYEDKDVEAAQAILDKVAKAAGYRYKAYHGTPDGGFTVFDNSHRFGEIYFTDNEYIANSYKNNYAGENPTVYSSYLRMPNPLRYDAKRKSYNELANEGKIESLVSKARENGNGGVIIKNIYDAPSGWSKDPANLGTDYLVLGPSDIKSADPFTFDDNGNLIPLSERFNTESDDIRFRISGENATFAEEDANELANDIANEVYRQISSQENSGNLATEVDSESDGEVLFRFIGELGADRLDKTDGGRRILDLIEAKKYYTPDSAENIKRAYGWELDKDAKGNPVWKYEENDFGIKDLNIKDGAKLSDVIDDEGLFAAYPELKNYTLAIEDLKDSSGYLNEADKKIALEKGAEKEDDRLILIHEIQHFIQDKEGWVRGANIKSQLILDTVKDIFPYIRKDLNMFLKSAAKRIFNKSYKKESISNFRSFTDKWGFNPIEYLFQLKKANYLAYVAYLRKAGEVEARNAEKRADMTALERRRSLAPETEDRPRSRQWRKTPYEDVMFRIGPAAEMKKKGMVEYLTPEQLTEFTDRALQSGFTADELSTINDRAFEMGGDYSVPVLEHFARLAEKDNLDAHDNEIVEKARQSLVSIIGAKDETFDQNDMLWVAYDAVHGDEEGIYNQIHNRKVKRALDEASSVEPDLTLADYLKKAAEAKDDLIAQYTALRELANNLTRIMDAMSARRDYDRVTVGKLVSLTDDILTSKLMDDVTNGEIKRLTSIIRRANGMRDIQSRVNELYNLILTNNLRRLKGLFEKELKKKAVKIDSNNVVNQGALDLNGQIAMTAMKENLDSFSEDQSGNIVISQTLADKIADARDRTQSEDAKESERADMELLGLTFARDYIDGVVASEKEEQQLRDALKEADEALRKDEMNHLEHLQFVKEQTRALAECRTERVGKFTTLLQKMQDLSAASHELALMMNEKDKERIAQIHHDANSDMQGVPSDEHPKDATFLQRLSNNPFTQFFFRPLATFDQMLRLFGNKSVNGEGYLWNRFMRGWIDAAGKEYKALQAAYEILDDKVSKVFGKKMRWSDLYSVEAKMPKATISFWDGGTMKEHELTQGNLLYIMLADQMTDGRMKLRAMGITEEDVDAIRSQMDARFKDLADWIVNDFLPSRREAYNEVHERMFGASMSKVQNYFPLKVLSNARTQQVDVASASTDPSTPSTVTGSIMKRTRNALALDVMGTDAFSLVIEHVQKMEHWAAFAEWNRDLSDLLSYKRFRNQVQNMTSIYGSQRNLWTEFVDTAMIAAGSYKGKSGKLDPALNRMAKGVTAAKISLRVFTAIKQFLSFPAYFSEANPVYLAAGFVKGWNWSMDNLPLFEKRWKSRQAGDHILAEGNLGKINEYLASIGMTPNALVDAFTVSIGSYAIYKTKYDKYIKMGFSPEAADKRAKQDAVILYNETQQSSEAAFMSSMQSGRSTLEKMFTVFRNSSMGYQRQVHDALRNYKHRLTPGYKKDSIEYMTKQLIREGLTEGQAMKAAKGLFARQGLKDMTRLMIFGYGLQFFWSLAPYLPYLLFGDDDDKKKEMLVDAAEKGVFGSLEGLTGGNLMSEAGNLLVFGEGLNNWDPSLLPLISDFTNLYQEFGKDNVRAMNDLLNLGIQMGIGVNPQTLEDAVVAIIDACNGDLGTAKEAMLLGLRIINAPQTSLDQLYLDEIDMAALEAKDLTIPELAERYVKYKKAKGAGAMAPLYSLDPALDDKITAKYLSSFENKAKERLDGIESDDMYAEIAEQAKAMDTRVKDLRKLAKSGDEDAEKELMEIFLSDDFGPLIMFNELSKDVETAINNAVSAPTREEMVMYLDEAERLRSNILKDFGDRESNESWFRAKYTQYTKGFLPEMARLEKKYSEEYAKANPKYKEWMEKHQQDLDNAADKAKANAERVAEIDAELKKYEIELPNGKKRYFNQPARKKLQEEKKALREEGTTEKAYLNRLKKQEGFTPEDFMPPAIYNSPEFQTYLEFKSLGSVSGNNFRFKTISEWETKMNEAEDPETRAKYREKIDERMILLGQQITRKLSGVDDEDDGFSLDLEEDLD